jgi:hypothetical protein
MRRARGRNSRFRRRAERGRALCSPRALSAAHAVEGCPYRLRFERSDDPSANRNPSGRSAGPRGSRWSCSVDVARHRAVMRHRRRCCREDPRAGGGRAICGERLSDDIVPLMPVPGEAPLLTAQCCPPAGGSCANPRDSRPAIHGGKPCWSRWRAAGPCNRTTGSRSTRGGRPASRGGNTCECRRGARLAAEAGRRGGSTRLARK